jgi:hypothetical protein
MIETVLFCVWFAVGFILGNTFIHGEEPIPER